MAYPYYPRGHILRQGARCSCCITYVTSFIVAGVIITELLTKTYPNISLTPTYNRIFKKIAFCVTASSAPDKTHFPAAVIQYISSGSVTTNLLIMALFHETCGMHFSSENHTSQCRKYTELRGQRADIINFKEIKIKIFRMPDLPVKCCLCSG